MDKNEKAIEIRDLTVSYNKKPVLWGVGVDFLPVKLTGIVGPNGAGKSTLFKAIMGIIKPDSGGVRFFGKSLKHARKQLSYVPQRQSVDWHFPASIYDVVMMGRYAHMGFLKRPTAQDKRVVAKCLEQVGLTNLATRQIGELSGGQQQRVFLARALAQESEIYLLDEPFAGVDVSTEHLTLEILQQLTAAGKTVVIIHHSLQSVERYCDDTVLLNVYVRAAGPTEKVLQPALLKEVYGSDSTVLSDMGHLLHEKRWPVDEEK